jgi:formylglycine-generating enzyme required for sulfatase activity
MNGLLKNLLAPTCFVALLITSCEPDNGEITELNCSTPSITGTITQGSPATNVIASVTYTSDGDGSYEAQTIQSTGVLGLTATIPAGNFSDGSGTLSYTISGTPQSSGVASFAISVGGHSCALTLTVNGGGGGNLLNIETSLIPAGTFTMGSPLTEPQRGSDEVQHQVTLSAFRMSTYETTNAQYAAFLNANNIGSNGLYVAGAYPNEPLIYDCGSYNGLSWTGSQWQPLAGKENFPVNCVTMYGAQEFATYAGGRLPTEAEWEYACRGGSTTVFSTGACLNNAQANYFWNFPLTGCINTSTAYPNQTQAVNSYSPNAYGLYNMHGNVWEWCADWYGAYPTTAQTNPTGPTSGTGRVIRGGGWNSVAHNCRSALRDGSYPYISNRNIGIRLAFAP